MYTYTKTKYKWNMNKKVIPWFNTRQLSKLSSNDTVFELEQIGVNTEPVVVAGTMPNDTDFPVASQGWLSHGNFCKSEKKCYKKCTIFINDEKKMFHIKRTRWNENILKLDYTNL